MIMMRMMMLLNKKQLIRVLEPLLPQNQEKTNFKTLCFKNFWSKYLLIAKKSSFFLLSNSVLLIHVRLIFILDQTL